MHDVMWQKLFYFMIYLVFDEPVKAQWWWVFCKCNISIVLCKWNYKKEIYSFIIQDWYGIWKNHLNMPKTSSQLKDALIFDIICRYDFKAIIITLAIINHHYDHYCFHRLCFVRSSMSTKIIITRISQPNNSIELITAPLSLSFIKYNLV